MTIMPRLVYIVTSASSTSFLRGQLTYMRKRGFDVVVISSPGDEISFMREREDYAASVLKRMLASRR